MPSVVGITSLWVHTTTCLTGTKWVSVAPSWTGPAPPAGPSGVLIIDSRQPCARTPTQRPRRAAVERCVLNRLSLFSLQGCCSLFSRHRLEEDV